MVLRCLNFRIYRNNNLHLIAIKTNPHVHPTRTTEETANATGAQFLRGNNLQEESAFHLFHLGTGHLLQGDGLVQMGRGS